MLLYKSNLFVRGGDDLDILGLVGKSKFEN